MANSETLSVVIPVHNRIRLFLRCLKSVFSQSYQNIKIVVVDDASKPIIKDYLKASAPKYLKQIRIIRNLQKKGPAFSRNRGTKIIKEGYVSFLDSDDVWNKDFAEQMIKHLSEAKTSIITCTLRPKFIGNISFTDKLFYLLLSISRYCCFYTMFLFNKGILNKYFFYMTRLSGTVFKNKIIKGISFDPKYKAVEDWKFIYEVVAKNGGVIRLFPKTLVEISHHKSGETMGRSNYYNFYENLMNEMPSSVRKSMGIKFFKVYTDFAMWKNKNK